MKKSFFLVILPILAFIFSPMDGQNFEIHCNGELITSFSDNNSKKGDIGFGVYNSIGVAFENIRISSLR